MIVRNPVLWKVYGSIDGINWEEIPEAGNTMTKLTSADYTNNNNNNR